MTAETLQSRLTKKFGQNSGDMSLRRQIPDSLDMYLRMHSVWLLSGGRFGRRFVVSNRLKDGVTPRRKTYLRMEMDGFYFLNTKFDTVTFSWSNLRLASFAGAELKDVVFEGCDLEGADFTGATFDNVTFKDCLDLEKAFRDRVQYRPIERHHQNHEPSIP